MRHKIFQRKRVRWMALLLAVLVCGYLLPESRFIPVQGASSRDWNPRTFWYSPWGKSGVHKGIDIFAAKGRPVIAATGGVVIFSGELGIGGEVLAVLGPRWRIHYYAHLDKREAGLFAWVGAGEQIGSVGDTGNAKGKAPHLHYSIVSVLPRPWAISAEAQGWKKMFFIDPQRWLRTAPAF